MRPIGLTKDDVSPGFVPAGFNVSGTFFETFLNRLLLVELAKIKIVPTSSLSLLKWCEYRFFEI